MKTSDVVRFYDGYLEHQSSVAFNERHLHLIGVMRRLGLGPDSRVLELGCGNGSNLVSHAFGLPDSHFVGVDLSEKHIEIANSSAAELDLPNIEFRKMDVMEMDVEDFGQFDYITAHGLFSWVPEFVREKVLSLFEAMLTENGVGYVSYNAYPGAYQREMVRSIMRLHTNQIDDPQAKVDQAISFLRVLSENTTDQDVYRQILKYAPPARGSCVSIWLRVSSSL